MKRQLLLSAVLSLAVFGATALPARAGDPVDAFVSKDLALPTAGCATFCDPESKAVVGAGYLGAKVGVEIEKNTGAGSKAGDWLYNNSNRRTAEEAVKQFDNASERWNQGQPIDATLGAARGLGKMVEGYINW